MAPGHSPDETQTTAASAASPASGRRTFQNGQLLAGRFRIERFIANGGMGEVYEATDTELGERVALKTIRPELAPEGDALDRFRREIQLARRVTHPNVCRVFDLARADGVTFLTMELLPGETLAARLKRSGPMPPAEALPLARHMADGLAAAHKAGIVHRDFKSANVILAGEDRAVITDFGVAHSTGDERTGDRFTVAGTPGYMAPEQFAGRPVTQATDVYAFGVVLHEMLTGERPPASGPRDGLDPRWAATIRRCLDADPSRRFASATDAAQSLCVSPRLPAEASSVDVPRIPALPAQALSIARPRLRRTALIAALPVLAAAGFAAGGLFHRAPALPAEKHIAVLPFHYIGPDAAGRAFSEGIAETLAGRLSQLEAFHKSLWVVPASESRRTPDAGSARRTLGVTLVVEGTLQPAGDAVRLTLNLVDAQNLRLLESRTLKAPVSELGALDDRVSEQLASMLAVQLNPSARTALAAGRSRTLAATEFYEQATGYAARRSPGDQDRAIELFQKAIDADPNFAAAYAGLGDVYSRKFETTRDPQFIALCRKHAARACELNDNLAPVHLSAGQSFYRTGEYGRAAGEFKRAIDLNPSSAEAYFWLGRVYEDLGKVQDAQTAFETSIALRPGYPAGYSGLGSLFWRASQYDKAEAAFRKMIALAPDNLQGYYNLGGVYLAQARYTDAEDILKKSLAIRPTAAAWSNLASAYMLEGRYAGAVPALEKAVDLAPKYEALWGNLGDAYSGAPGLEAKAPAAYRKAFALAESQLEVNPKDANVLSSLALYAAKLNLRAQAASYAARALHSAAGDNNVRLKAAEAYALTDRRNDAVETLAAMLKDGFPKDRLAREPELGKLRADARFSSMLKGTR